MTLRLQVAFDGSKAAEAAVATAGALHADAHGEVLTVFDPPSGYEQVQRFGFGVDAKVVQRGVEALRRQVQDAARTLADRGAAAAGAAGLHLEIGPTPTGSGFAEGAL